LMLVKNAEFHGLSRRDTLPPKLSSLAGRVASAFLPKRLSASGAQRGAPLGQPGETAISRQQ